MSKASLGSGSRRRGWAADTRSVILCPFDTGSASSFASERNAEAGISKVVLGDDQLGRWQETYRRVVVDWVISNSGEFDTRRHVPAHAGTGCMLCTDVLAESPADVNVVLNCPDQLAGDGVERVITS